MTFLASLKGLGTVVNVIAVILGGIIGMLFGKKMKEPFRESVMNVLGLAVMFVGLGGALSRMLKLNGSGLETYGTMMMIICLVLGTVLGEILNLEKHLETFGEWLKRKVRAKNDNRFVDAFVSTSLVVCVGAMAIVGSIEDGLTGDHTTLFAKALLDFLIVIVMASSMGLGCMFAFIPIGILQGSVTLVAGLIKPYVTDALVGDLSLVGSVMICAVGLNLILGKKFKVGNMLPSLIFVVIYSLAGINL